ncbi:MAG: AhpC/TSA family protein [Flavobacteriaceae bacterium]|nr:AhpC/TSA family protein [Flavobacteriaceae bacterium]
MKKLLMLLAFISVIACKKKEEQPTESKVEETVELSNQESKIDYASYGMKAMDAPKGLEKGTLAPEVNLTIDGEQVALSDIYKDQKVALIFYRGYWCPVCNKHLSEFATRAKELQDKGLKLIAITPEAQGGIDKTKEKTKADFIIVSDTDGSIQKAFDVDYGVTNEYTSKVQEKLKVAISENNANGKSELPVPATYVINTSGEIIFAHFDPDYHNRASIDEILGAL